MANQKLLVKEKEYKLLMNSNSANNNPWLIEFLEKNHRMKEEDLEYQTKDVQNFFNDIYSKLLKQCSEEWEPDGRDPVDYIDNGDIRCELCNHSIKNICYIVNKLDKTKRLMVGTECVLHFGMSKGVPIEKLLKEKMRIKKLEKLNNIFPGIERMIYSWDQELDRYPIIIPREIEQPYIDLGDEVKEIYENYLDDVKMDISLDILKYLGKKFSERDKMLFDMSKYCRDNRNKRFIPPEILLIIY